MKRFLIFALLLAGCSTPAPTPFRTGAEVSEPSGCTMARERGVEC